MSDELICHPEVAGGKMYFQFDKTSLLLLKLNVKKIKIPLNVFLVL